MTPADIAARIRNGASVDCTRVNGRWCAVTFTGGGVMTTAEWAGSAEHVTRTGTVKHRRPTCPACLRALGLAVVRHYRRTWRDSISSAAAAAIQRVYPFCEVPSENPIRDRVRDRRRYRQSHRARR